MSLLPPVGGVVQEREKYQLDEMEWIGVIVELVRQLAAGPLPCGAIGKILAAHSVLRMAMLAIWVWMVLGNNFINSKNCGTKTLLSKILKK